MRKRIIGAPRAERPDVDSGPWIDVEQLALVEVTSEDPAHPIDAAFGAGEPGGWRAETAGEQTIRLLFDEPQSLRRVQMHFVEDQCERAQEFVLRWSAGEGQPAREIVRQQFHFSPGGAVRELEDYRVELDGVRLLELTIIPDRARGQAHATLAQMRLGSS